MYENKEIGRSREEILRRRRMVKWLILAVVGFLTTTALAYLYFSDNSVKKVVQSSVEKWTSKDKITLVFSGLDERADDVGRTDTLLWIVFDPVDKSVEVLSVPRDTRVKIPGFGWDKINHAYADGGFKLTHDTLANFLGVKIDYSFVMNFHGFVRLIDAIGGVDINVEKKMYYSDPYDDDGGLVIDFKPGMQHMDGKQAIEYVRFRDEEGDIGRVKRQQAFMKAFLDRITTPSVLPKIPSLIKEFYNDVTTNMDIGDMLKLSTFAVDVQKKGIKAEMVPGRPLYIDGVSYWIPDVVKTRNIVAQYLDLKSDSVYLLDARELSDVYENSIPNDKSRVSEDGSGFVEKPDRATKTKSVEKDVTADSKKTTDKPTKPDEPTTNKTVDTKRTDPPKKPDTTTTVNKPNTTSVNKPTQPATN